MTVVVVSSRPNCSRTTCVLCAKQAHPGSPCVDPLCIGDDNVLQGKLYRAYAVGRVASCEHCGRHIERNGGCDEMKCTCGHTFKFVPFTSQTQVSDAIATSTAIAIARDAENTNRNTNIRNININIPRQVRRIGCHVLMLLSIVLWIIYVFGLVIFTSATSSAKNERAFLVLLVVFPVLWMTCYCCVPLIVTTGRFRQLWDVEDDMT